MAAKKPVERKVYFFQLQRRARTTLTHIPDLQAFDWSKILEVFDKSDWKKHWFDDDQYCLAVLGDRQYPILTIGEKLKTQFMQRIDNRNEQMTDLADESIKEGKINLAQMSAVVFFPKCNAIGYITGSGKPRTSVLEIFLNSVVRENRQAFEWQVVPIYKEDGIKEFNEKMKSVHSARFTFSTQKAFIGSADDGGELLGIAKAISDELQCDDLNLDIKVTIPSRLQKSRVAQTLKGLVSKAAPIISWQQKTINVKGTALDDTVVDFEILRHPFALKAIVPHCDETRQFTQLVDALVDVCATRESEVYELLEG